MMGFHLNEELVPEEIDEEFMPEVDEELDDEEDEEKLEKPSDADHTGKGEKKKEDKDALLVPSDLEEETETLEDDVKFPDFVLKMGLSRELKLQIAYNAYKASADTELLESEKGRTLYSEAFSIRVRPKRLYFHVPLLRYMAREVVFDPDRFKISKIKPKLNLIAWQELCEQLSAKWPMSDALDIEDDIYWRKVARKICSSEDIIKGRPGRGRNSWKSLAVQARLRDIIENLIPGSQSEEFHSLMKRFQPYVFDLQIKHLIPTPKKFVKKDANLSSIDIFNCPMENCHHSRFEFLGYFTNLRNLLIEFAPEKYQTYERHSYNFSYRDMTTLARGLSKLVNLESLKICRSRLDYRRAEILLDGLTTVPLNELEFSCCQLRDECADLFANLMTRNNNIRVLELCGNFFARKGLMSLMYGVLNYGGQLEYLGLSCNIVTDDGLVVVQRYLENAPDQVQRLNIRGIQVSEECADVIADILKKHTKLISLDICGLPIRKKGGDLFLEIFEDNVNLLNFYYSACELTLEQEYQLRIYILRNNFLQENDMFFIRRDLQKYSSELYLKFKKWLKRPLQNNLLKVQAEIERLRHCKPEIFSCESFLLIPKFIQKVARNFHKIDKDPFEKVYFKKKSIAIVDFKGSVLNKQHLDESEESSDEEQEDIRKEDPNIFYKNKLMRRLDYSFINPTKFSHYVNQYFVYNSQLLPPFK